MYRFSPILTQERRGPRQETVNRQTDRRTDGQMDRPCRLGSLACFTLLAVLYLATLILDCKDW